LVKGWNFGETNMLQAKVWNPIEKTVKKWLFRFPGIYTDLQESRIMSIVNVIVLQYCIQNENTIPSRRKTFTLSHHIAKLVRFTCRTLMFFSSPGPNPR